MPTKSHKNKKTGIAATYHKLVRQISQKYAVLKRIDPKELEQMAKELKGHWKRISAQLAKAKHSAKKRPHKRRR